MVVILLVLDAEGKWDRFYSDAIDAALRAEAIGGTVKPWIVLQGNPPLSAQPAPVPVKTAQPAPVQEDVNGTAKKGANK